MRRVVLGILVVMSLAATAHAQPGRVQPEPLMVTHTERYATTVIAVDAAATGLFSYGLYLLVTGLDDYEGSSGDDRVVGGILSMALGALAYEFGGPIVHGHYRNPTSAWKSLVLRLGLPTLGSMIGGLSGENDEAAAWLSVAGVGAAMVIDWVALAKHEVLVPYAAPVPGGGGTLGVATRF